MLRYVLTYYSFSICSLDRTIQLILQAVHMETRFPRCFFFLCRFHNFFNIMLQIIWIRSYIYSNFVIIHSAISSIVQITRYLTGITQYHMLQIVTGCFIFKSTIFRFTLCNQKLVVFPIPVHIQPIVFVHRLAITQQTCVYTNCTFRYINIQSIIITNNLVKFPNTPCAIPESDVDYVVVMDDIGDPKGIMSGATRYTKNPKELIIAKTAAEVVKAAGYVYDGFSMQMGSGGASLATARYLRQMMIDEGIKCRFALGGITGQITAMHEEGLIEKILDVQSFDLDAAKSLKKNHFHQQIDAPTYASYRRESAVNQLDFVILSALEVDTDFNVNVLTGSDGVIRGAIGGHPDTAEGAALSVIVCPLTRGRIPCVVPKVNTVVTPGSVVDVVITDQGVAVNPNRPEVAEKLVAAGIPVVSIESLAERADTSSASLIPSSSRIRSWRSSCTATTPSSTS